MTYLPKYLMIIYTPYLDHLILLHKFISFFAGLLMWAGSVTSCPPLCQHSTTFPYPLIYLSGALHTHFLCLSLATPHTQHSDNSVIIPKLASILLTALAHFLCLPHCSHCRAQMI